MQPEYLSKEYKNQVDTIYTVISGTDCKIGEVTKFLLPYVLDMDYH